jgi:hypothetical protein
MVSLAGAGRVGAVAGLDVVWAGAFAAGMMALLCRELSGDARPLVAKEVGDPALVLRRDGAAAIFSFGDITARETSVVEG